MRLSFLHLVFLFDETSSVNVSKFGVTPCPIRVSSLSKPCLGFKAIVHKLVSNLVVILGSLNSLKMIGLSVLSGLFGCLWQIFQSLFDLRLATAASDWPTSS